MPDTDTLIDDQTRTGATEAGAPAHEADNADDFYVGTWKDREAAERGIREQRAALTKAQQEAARLRDEQERIRENILAKLADRADGNGNRDSKPATQAVDWDALKREIDENPHRAIEITQQWLREVDEGNREVVNQVKSELAKEIESLRESILASSPEYQQHKELVEQIKQTTGCKTKQAVELAKTLLATRGPAQPEAPLPPGAIRNDAGGYGASSGEGDVTVGGLLNQLVGDLTPAEIKELKRMRRKQ